MAAGVLFTLLTRKCELVVRGVYGAGKTKCIALLAAFFALRGHHVYYASRENTTITAMAEFVQKPLPRGPDDECPGAIRLLSSPQARNPVHTPIDAQDTDRNSTIWQARLVLATTGLHHTQFCQRYRPLGKATEYAELFIYDEAQQEASLGDAAILGALPRKCLVLRLGDPKQTSGGTGPGPLARKVREVSDGLGLGIRAQREPILSQSLPKLAQKLLIDGLPDLQHDDIDQPADEAQGESPIGGKPSRQGTPADELSASGARAPILSALLHVVDHETRRWHQARDIEACSGGRPPHDWCIMLPLSQRVQPGVYILMALGRYRDALVKETACGRPLVYQPLHPALLTASFQVLLVPPRHFRKQRPVTTDVFRVVALFLQLRASYPQLCDGHSGAGSLLLTPRLDVQATFAKLFADIGVEGDIRYADLPTFMAQGPPPASEVVARHVQALRADLRAETFSHAAGLTSHTTVLLFGSSKFLGRDEMGHCRTTVGLTRARGTTILLGPPDPYGLLGLIQTVLAYCYAVHSADWVPDTVPLPFVQR